LYDLSVNKNCLVGEMFALGVEEGGRGLAVAQEVVGLGGGLGSGVSVIVV